jgi:hypothetical protein
MTMRERLIQRAVAEMEAGLPVAPGVRSGPVQAGYHRLQAVQLVNVILAELREPDEIMLKAALNVDAWTGEPVAREFTAMIDVVREDQA